MKQDGVLAPDLFNLFFTCMWLHIVQGLRERVYIRYQLYSSLFDLLCLKEQMKSLHTALQKTLFIDDSAQLALKDNDLQFMMNKFLYTAMLFGLSAWTRLKHFTSPDQTLTCRPNNLCWWHSCKHLQILRKHHDGSLDKETDSRISKISQTLRCLCIILLNQHNIHISAWNCCYLFSPKGMGVPDSVLMANQMEKFQCVLCSIFDICWQDRASNLRNLDHVKSTSTESLIITAQMWWVGHVIGMANTPCLTSCSMVCWR